MKFLFLKKKNTQSKEKTKDTEESSNNLSRLVIKFILEEEEKNSIILGKRNDAVFICFKHKEVASFLKQWYPILKMRVTEEIDDKFYSSFVSELKKKLFTSEFDKEVDEKEKETETDNFITVNGVKYKKIMKGE